MRKYRWPAGWYHVWTAKNVHTVWLGPRQAAKVARTLEWRLTSVERLERCDRQAWPKPATTLAGLVWQKILNGANCEGGCLRPGHIDLYRGWRVEHNINAPATGQWRATRWGVSLCAGTREMMQRMVDQRILDGKDREDSRDA